MATAFAVDDHRWTATATDGCCLRQGDPMTLTYSFVPDGTPIASGIGEPAAPSNLRAFLNGIYGSPSVWMPLFHRVFAQWGEQTGIHYVFQPTDDGAQVPDAPGELGVRGDVRIGGHVLDGTGGVMAFNWYPSTGDMVLDTGDTYFNETGAESILLRNVVAHEHGHGIGLDHTCPMNQTKLMEAITWTGFEGPQHDETVAGQRDYGDPLESNDTAQTATDLGTLATALSVDEVSIDAGTDRDFYRFTVGVPKRVSVAVTPVGLTYPHGTASGSGSCGATTTFDSRAQGDLVVEILASNGSTVLATANAAPAGASEQLTDVQLPAAGSYFVRVRSAASQDVQLYRLDLSTPADASAGDVIFDDGFESGDLSAWTTFRDGRGQMVVGPAGALEGSAGLRIALGDSASSYVTDRSPNDEPRYRARFRLDAGAYVPATATARLQLLKVFSSTPAMRWMIILSLRKSGDRPEIQARVRLDDGGSEATPFLTLENRPQSIELDWEKGSGPGANDGRLRLWIDGVLAATVDQLDNDLQRVKHTRFGVMGASTSSSGAIRLDGFKSRRQSYVGP
jgi:hypothetical protein